MANWRELLMMVQKSGVHQLRLVFEIPLSTVGFLNPRWFSRRISETPEVTRNAVEMDWTWKKSDCESFRNKPTIFFPEFWGKVIKISKKAIRFRSCDGTSTFDIKLNAIVFNHLNTQNPQARGTSKELPGESCATLTDNQFPFGVLRYALVYNA